MKTKDFLNHYKHAVKVVRTVTKRIMLSNMISQNLDDLLKGCEKEPWPYSAYGLRIKIPNIALFENRVKKFRKIFHQSPHVEINKEYMVASFWLRPKMGDLYGESILLELMVGNTEKCDIEVIKEEVEVTKLTGYCKQLKEMLEA